MNPARASSPLPFGSPLLEAQSGVRDEDARTFSALGSAVRMRILSSIATREKSIAQIARELGLNRVTLRYHLGYLKNQGLIEEATPAGPRGVGRPATLYRASKHAHVSGFPRRRFELLGQLALEALAQAVGNEKASQYLRMKGAEAGKAMIAELGASAKVERWTPEAFERFVLRGLFRDFGIPIEVLSKSSLSLTYRAFDCPFLELAEKMPGLVCNSLDKGFHSGIDEALGGVRTERLACMGHGDPYCEYRVTWKRRAASKLPRRRARKAKPRMEGRKDG